MAAKAGSALYSIPSHVPPWGWHELLTTVRCVVTGHVVDGPDIDKFSQSLRKWTGLRHVMAVNRGRSAIELALRAMGVGHGDEVVTSTLVCEAVERAIERVGASAVFSDSGQGLHSDAVAIQEVLTARTRAVIVPHLYGEVAAIDAIEESLAGTDIALIDDAAQSIGARCQGRMVGTFGRCGIVSTGIGKTLAGLAGGALVTDDDEWFEGVARQPLAREKSTTVMRRALSGWLWFRLRRFTVLLKGPSDRLLSARNRPWSQPCRMSNLDAAIALLQLKRVEAEVMARRARANRVLSLLGQDGIDCLSDISGSSTLVSLVLVLPPRAANLDQVIGQLRAVGIEAGKSFQPRHLLNGSTSRLPNAEELAKQALIIPLTRSIRGPRQENALRGLGRTSGQPIAVLAKP